MLEIQTKISNLSFKQIFTPGLRSKIRSYYEKFLSLITAEVTSQLEKAVIKCTFNRVSYGYLFVSFLEVFKATTK